MTTDATETGGTVDETRVAARLSTLDRFLPAWIGAVMALGLLLGRVVPSRRRQPGCWVAWCVGVDTIVACPAA